MELRALARSFVALALLAGCEAETPRGLADTDRSLPGPTVVFDPLRRPSPEIPFPNDLALRVQPDGTRRLNLSMWAPTGIEKDQRRHADEIDGFSGLTPITVAFDGPLDVTTVTDTTAFVINVQGNSKRFGEVARLDLGRGYFPHQADPHAYLPHDPHKDFDSYVLPPDNKVDADGDGVAEKWLYHYEVATHTLDLRPLMPLEAGAQYAVVLTRGIKGWDGQGKYGPIRSPFDIVNHDSQTAALEKALPALAKAGVQRKDVAFAWTLTTGDLSRTFRSLRDGLYGKGPFAWLAAQFPPKIADVYDTTVTFDGDASNPAKPYPVVPWDHRYVLQGPYISSVLSLINLFQPGLAGDFSHVSHVAFGELTTPNLRATPDNVWQLDLVAGKFGDGKGGWRQTAVPEQVPFLLVVPKTTASHKPPFPVAIYAHATGTSRIECLLLADRFAQAGIATFAIDAVGHGPVLTEPRKMIEDALSKLGGGIEGVAGLVRGILGPLLYLDPEAEIPETMTLAQMIDKLTKHGFMQQLAVKGRAVDDNGDCFKQGGEAYFAPNAFRLRDAMRQTTLDFLVAVRLLHELGTPPKPPADMRKASKEELLPSLLAGDFDGDGTLDIGGASRPDGSPQPYFMTGVSLGGIHTALTAPLEPYIVAAAPVVPGAGLADIFMRTRLHSVVTPLMHTISGPMVVACPLGAPAGQGATGPALVRLSWNDDSDNCKDATKVTYTHAVTGKCLEVGVAAPYGVGDLVVPAGARVTVRNGTTGEAIEGEAGKDGAFALAVAADRGDPIHVEVRASGGGAILAQAKLKSPHEGLARQRNTPEFRRFVQLAANVLEGADAITVADRVLLDPLPGLPAKSMLMLLAVGDRTVPFTTGVALARAMGLFGRGDPQSLQAPYRAWTDAAIGVGLLVGKDSAPPLLDPTLPEGGPGLCRFVETVPGKPQRSGLCLADVRGHHEYIAGPKLDKDNKPITLFPKVDGYNGTYTEYHKNQIVTYFHSLAKRVGEDPCWADAKCVAARGLRAEWDLPLGTVQ